MMRVLVTGGAGFIGSHTVDGLRARGHDVRILDALRPPVHDGAALPAYVSANAGAVILRDVRDRAAWEEALRNIDAVFHLAAYQDYLPDFSTFVHVNAVSTALLYEVIAAEHLPIRKVILASSQAVYGEGKYICRSCPASAAVDGPRDPVRFPEPRDDTHLQAGKWDVLCPECGAPMEPQWTDELQTNVHNAYAISKYSQELIAMTLGKRYDIPTVAPRYSIVQGSRQSFRNAYSGVLRIFAQRLLAGRSPICYEDGNQLRDYVSVQDVVRANLLVLEDSRADFQVFNVGGNRRVSVVEYARLISARAGRAIEPQIPGTYRFGDTRHILSDVTRLMSLGWKPVVPLEQIVDEYLEWLRADPEFRDHSARADERMEMLGVLRRATMARPQ
jgi:dTDP-L-rhamnose 4-epimerase